jgi:hypothetical protein
MALTTDALARVCEHAETGHLIEQARAFARLRPEIAAQVVPFAGGVAVLSAPEFGHKLNRVTGAGFDEPITEDALAALEQRFADRATPLEVDLCPYADARSLQALAARGYAVESFTNTYAIERPRRSSPTPAPCLRREAAVQRALLAHRLQRARTLGARLATVAARPATTSARNTERAGLQLIYNKPTVRRPS